MEKTTLKNVDLLAGNTAEENDNKYGIYVDGSFIINEAEFQNKYISVLIDFNVDRKALLDWKINSSVRKYFNAVTPLTKLTAELEIKSAVEELKKYNF